MEITRTTKIAILATVIGMISAKLFLPMLFLIIVPNSIVLYLIITYQGAEKVGIVGLAKQLQSVFAVCLVSLIVFLIMWLW